MPTTNRRVVILALAMLVVGLCIVLAALLIPAWRAASAVKADLESLESLASAEPESLDARMAADLVRTMGADLETLHAAARPFLWAAPYLGWLPVYGPDIQAAPLLLEMALDLTAAAEGVIEPLTPLLDQATDEESSGGMVLLQEATVALAAAEPQLLEARSAVLRARAARATIDARRLSPRLEGWMARLDQYLPLLEQGISGALILPEVLGVDGPRVYLLLIQNEDELRATGGFISGVAQVTVESGRLVSLQFEDGYDVDDLTHEYPAPPDPLRDYMLTDLWLFRDSNWSPDFPTSAQAALSLYTIGRDVEADGVVALDQQAIRLLVGSLGPLQVEGVTEPVTGDNVVELAQEAWAPGDAPQQDWWQHRKDFFADLLTAARDQIENRLDRDRMIGLARASFSALEHQHLLVYLVDEDMAPLLAELGWDGSVLENPGDYLMVVDTNMGFNKVNALVEESLNYVVNLTDLTSPHAILAVRHNHPLEPTGQACDQEPRYDPTYGQMMRRCYWDYLRVLMPGGVDLLSATPHPVSGAELLSGQDAPAEVTLGPPVRGRTVMATLLLLRPGESLETIFEYSLPNQVLRFEDGRYEYSLLVQKQPGTRDVPLRVHLLLPPGADIMTTSPSPLQSAEVGLVFDLVLDTHQTIAVTFQLSE